MTPAHVAAGKNIRNAVLKMKVDRQFDPAVGGHFTPAKSINTLFIKSR